MWSKDSDKNGISKVEMESYFDPENRGFIRHFFTDTSISCNDFVLFVCFFLFYNADDILTVLLAMCGITSNLMITKEQVNRFLINFGFNCNRFEELFLRLESSFPEYIYIYIYCIVLHLMFMTLNYLSVI